MDGRFGIVLVGLLVTIAGFAGVTSLAAAGGPAGSSTGSDALAAAPADPTADRLGWEDGYWYNESIDVEEADGLDREELDALIARTMARVEHLRRLEFERRPPVRFVSRDTFADAVAEGFRNLNVTPADRLHQNAKYEALFLVGEDTDFYRVERANQQAFAAAFYTARGFPPANVSAGEIAIVTTTDGAAEVSETTLAHELVHALQDQHFGLASAPTGHTEDEARAIDGVIEGDASYVGSLYAERCGGTWNCVDTSAGGGASFVNYGLAFYGLVQYGNGLTFVEAIRERGGWAAVNALYGDYPASTEQVIHPSKYPEETPANLTIEDRSGPGWRPLDLPGGADHATFGEAGLYVMLWYPSYASGSDVVIPRNDVFVSRRTAPYDFTHPVSTGWNGDRLLPFVTNESVATNETGYVWKLAWDSPRDAREFLDGYRRLLSYHDAEEVAPNTYRIPEPEFGSSFADAIRVSIAGDRVIVVNAPTVEALSAVRGANATPTPTSTANPTPTATPLPGPRTGTPPETVSPGTATAPVTTSPGTVSTRTVPVLTRTITASPSVTVSITLPEGQSGFGPVVALVALLGIALLARVRG